MAGLNLAKDVTTSESYSWDTSNTDKPFKLAVLDCGVKYNILRHLEKRGCECVVLPLNQRKLHWMNTIFMGFYFKWPW